MPLWTLLKPLAKLATQKTIVLTIVKKLDYIWIFNFSLKKTFFIKIEKLRFKQKLFPCSLEFE